MKIYKVNFEDYNEDHFFSASSLIGAKEEAERWAEVRNQEDKEEYKEIDSISFELETEN